MTAPADTPVDGLVLRPAQPGDALCLSVLAIQVFLDTYATEGIRTAIAREVLATYSEGSFAQAVADDRTRLVVAERAGHLVGFAQVTLGARHALVPGGPAAELLRLYVQEPFTGRRVGTQLLQAAEQLAADAGSEVLWLTPWVHNTRARGFYASRGYADHGLTTFTFEGESHDNRVLAKSVVGTAAAPTSRELQALEKFYAAVNRQDLQAIAEDFDASITRIEPEGFRTAGTYLGIEAVREHVRKGRATWAEGRCDPEKFLLQGDRAVVYLHAWVRLHGATDWSGGRFADGFVFRQGKIVEYRSFAERAEALRWAGIREA